MSKKAPVIRTVDALNGRDTGDTSVFFRAMSDADRLMFAAEERDEALTRVQELQAELDAAPARTFIDDLGRRWEWCGGVEGTWAWRITNIGLHYG